jgi:hypothetical protein
MKEQIKSILPKCAFNALNAQRKQLKAFKNLASGYGQYKGLMKGTCLNANGEICPWYTFPALDYLARLDLSDCSVFEYGSGYSTLYYAERTKSVTAVEHHAGWFKKCKDEVLPESVNLIHAEEGKYVETLAAQKQRFDVIVIDAIKRPECAEAVKNQIESFGAKLVIFDNADWFEDEAQNLADTLGWVRVPMRGFGPLNDYAWQTDFLINPKDPLTLMKPQRKPVGQK